MPAMSDTNQKGAGTMMLANILAIIGSIILVVIIIWGLIHLLSISGGFFSSLFDGKGDTSISITAPSSVQSGQSTRISWKHRTSEAGSYAFIYPCTEGLRFSTHSATQTFTTIPCGAAYTLGTATTSATILPMLTGTTSIKTPLSVLFIPSATSSTPAEGTVTMTVLASSGTPAPSKPTTPVVTEPTKPTTPSTPTPTPSKPAAYGLGDLAATITSVSIDQYGNGTVTFNISNIGTGNSGSYYFTAQIPTAQPYTYMSPLQSSLAPGSYIVNTLRFTQAIPGQVYVIIDPSNTTAESNEVNNTDSQYISGSYPYYYNAPYQYPLY